jgi:ABC-type spermidine/putrescine transport system permease subunit II
MILSVILVSSVVMDFLISYTDFICTSLIVSSVVIWLSAVVYNSSKNQFEKTVSQLNNNLQLSELRQVSVAVCGRQCAADCRID